MKMRNWISNQPCVLEGVPDCIKNGPVSLDQTNERVLGMPWDLLTDQILFYPTIEDMVWTKRGVLRRSAQLFDPMGLLAAFVVRGKILMQELWRRGKDWDDPLEPDIKGYTLSPFMEEEGLLHLGGRLERSPLSYDCRHPIILGTGLQLAALLIMQSHEEVKHFGVNTVLCNLRQRYCPIRGREQD